MALRTGLGLRTGPIASGQASGGGGGAPNRALTLNGKFLQLNSKYLTLGT